MMSNLALFSYGGADVTMAGAAVFAALCGVVLMGGRLVVGRPLRMLVQFRNRGICRKPLSGRMIPSDDLLANEIILATDGDVHGVEDSLQRAG